MRIIERTAGLLLIGAVLAGCVTAFGGELEWNGDGAQPNAGESADGVSPEQMDLEQLYNYNQYVYVSTGGRDPMTYRLPLVREEETPAEDEGVTEPTEATQPTAVVGPQIPTAAEQRTRLSTAYSVARARIIYGAYEDALSSANDALEKVDEWGGPMKLEEGATQYYERLVSLRATAQRLANRKSIREEFMALPIEIRGIRWSPRGSAALINQEIVEAGMMLKLESGALIQVERIEEDGVVFMYKGQRLRKGMASAAPAE
jgi:hypothetical protein